ncbi:hypothetical protein UFOVP180_40 [uncultured Caudovirales phage]|uniref:Uncharacterized protein n=1 Tax=uncultured Caudovirales phage TaxID=2100421 RepID=A0A6J7WG16_9CAUD|nr:hypothetical protein UFOVP180_40 [uncultured Caudovirales phage]
MIMTKDELLEHLKHLEQLHQLMMMDFDFGVKTQATQRRAELEDEILETQQMLDLLDTDPDIG